MAFGTITSTSNTFGSVDGTATGSVPGTLSGSVGVPGPQGPAGSQGPAGPAGQGVPAGGTAGQFLTKIDGTNYNTDWTTLNVSDKRDLTDLDFTNAADEKLETFGVRIQKTSGMTEALYNIDLNAEQFNLERDTSFAGTVAGQLRRLIITPLSVDSLFQVFDDVDGTIIPGAGVGFVLDPEGLRFKDATGGQKANSIRYDLSSITFGNGSSQTTAFPGFNNAALTGNPTAPTATFGDNDTSIATTAFVQAGLLGGTANARNLEVEVRNQSGSTIAAGSIVYISGATGNLPLITLAQANNDANSAQTIGFVKTAITNNGTGYVIVRGVLEAINTSALTEGVQLYLSPTTAGTWTTTKPSAPQHLVYVGVVIRSHPTQGTILVAVQNGYELHELHDVALASEANNDLLVYELSTDLWKNKSFATLGLATTGDIPAFATNAQSISLTSTTTVSSPRGTKLSSLSTNLWAPGVSALSAGSSGTGSNANSGVTSLNGNLIAPNISTAGYATRGFNLYGLSNSNSYYNFGTESGHSVRLTTASWATTITAVKLRSVLGRAGNSLPVPGTLAARSYGWEWDFSTKVMSIIAHNGTTLTTTALTTAFVPVANRTYEIVTLSDGAGNISLYVDGTLLGTSTGGPTGNAASFVWWQAEIENTSTSASAGNTTITYQNPKVFTTNG